MDKTRNKIFVGCLALLLVMVAGYALFSQNLNITGTAKAQGEFSVTPTCQPGYDSKIKPIIDNLVATGQMDPEFLGETGYYDDSCTVNGDVVTFNVKFKYPGANRMFTLKVKNTGNMDTIFVDSHDTNSYYSNLGIDLNVEECFDKNENGIFDKKYECFTNSSYPDVVQLAVEDKDGNIYLLGDDAVTGIEKAYDTETGALKPGATIYILIASNVDKNLTAKKNFLFESTLTSKIIFKQPTVK